MLIGAPEKYTCAGCRKKFVSRICKPIKLLRVMGADKTGCECVKAGIVTIHMCYGHKKGEIFEGSEWVCSDECHHIVMGEYPPPR